MVYLQSWFCYFLLIFLITTIYLAEETNGWSIEFIDKDFIRSPFYRQNLSDQDRLEGWIKQSEARGTHLAHLSLIKEKSINSSISIKSTLRPSLSIGRPFYVVKLRIGSFIKIPTSYEYHLVMDTGSSTIWLQCED